MKQVISGLIIVLVPVAILLTGGDENPDHRAAADALELHYLDAGIYDPVRCRREALGDQPLVFCHPSTSREFGGLWAVTGSGAELAVHPVNGEAMQHATRSYIERVDGSPLRVAPWEGERIDIPRALAAFR